MRNPLCLCTNPDGELVFAFARMDGAFGRIYWVARLGSATGPVTYGPLGDTVAPRIRNATLYKVSGYSGTCNDPGTTNHPICATP